MTFMVHNIWLTLIQHAYSKIDPTINNARIDRLWLQNPNSIMSFTNANQITLITEPNQIKIFLLIWFGKQIIELHPKL